MIVALICVFAFVPLVIAVVRPLVSPSCIEPPVDTVPLLAVLVPFPVFEAACLLCDPVPLAEPFAALCEPVPLVLFVLLAALLAEFVPLAEPLPLLFGPVPVFQAPVFVFEPGWVVVMS